MSIQNLDPTMAGADQVTLFPKILAIEPDPSLGEILCDMLGSDGYHCKVLPECEDIKKEVEDFKPDIILIEYLLPGVNGGELCEQLKSDESFSGIPVILYSAYPQILWSVSDYRCDEFISKPFDVEKLLSIIERLFVKSRERRRFCLLADTLKNRLGYLSKFLGLKGEVA